MNQLYLLDCKIGRQTNLFKQTLKSSIDCKTNEMSNMACSSNGGSNSLLETNHASSYNYVSLDSLQFLNNTYDVEDSLDVNTKNMVKKIHAEYKALYYLPNNIVYQNYQGFGLALELIRMHRDDCLRFISNISCKFVNCLL